MINVGLLGADGRMGQMLSRLIAEDFKAEARVDAAVSKGQDFSHLFKTDVIIDFSLPEALEKLVDEAAGYQGDLPALVVGTTGYKVDLKRKLEAYGKRSPVMIGSNYSIGVNLMNLAIRSVVQALEESSFNPVIIEKHHKHKKDQPSGTARTLQSVVSPSGPGNVQTLSVRQGEIIGEHDAIFYGPSESITFSHKADDRTIFARGAIKAALWLRGKQKNDSLTGLLGVETFIKELTGQK